MCQRFVSSLLASCALVALMSLTGCSNTPDLSPADQQMMVELEKRYASGAISKEVYERERADIHARAQRESLESGSSLNTTIRGMQRR